jgi:hypothetical protein
MGSKWMVDVKGKGGEGGEEAVQKVLQDIDFKEYIESQGGLATAVQQWLEYKYSISDCGAGGGSWHLGMPFDNLMQAVTCLDDVTTQFAKAIACGLLRVELKTWSLDCWRT